jgi:hypothetical protein
MGMDTRSKVLFLLLILGGWCTAMAQSPAAMQKVAQKYGHEQLADMQQHTHYKYHGLVLFYSSSFMVVENGQARAATEDEISRINLDEYNSQRQTESATTVHDAAIDKDIQLLSRDAFEAVVLGQLNPADKEAYLQYKAQAIASQKTKMQ